MPDTNKKTYKRTYKLTIEVDEEVLRDRYPNYNLNFSNPDDFIDYIVAGFNNEVKDDITLWGYTAILEKTED